MRIESTAIMSNPRPDPHTILIHGQPLTEVQPTSGGIHTHELMTVKKRVFLIVIFGGSTHPHFKELILAHLQMFMLEFVLS